MENAIIDVIYELIRDKNLYNYNNNEEMKSAEIEEYKNLEDENVIKIKIGKTEYVVTCTAIWRGEEFGY